METSPNVPELIATARDNAQIVAQQIAEVREKSGGAELSGTQAEDLIAAYLALEALAVDTFTMFEARMQHHFKRGPFSRKLKALLVDAGRTELAQNINQYYLAINVLKHGIGASHRELMRDAPDAPFLMKPTENTQAVESDAPSILIDVGVPGFFEDLATTLLAAHQFLEDR